MAETQTVSDREALLEQELAEERRARRALVDASVSLNSLLSLPDLLTTMMQTATELLDAETSSILLLDEERHELTVEVATGRQGEGVTAMRLPADQGIAGWVLANRRPALVNDVQADDRFYAQIDRASGFTTRSILAVPLENRGRVIGVVEVINKRGGGFSERDQEIASAFAAQSAVALENARLYLKLADAVVESRRSYRL